jgi:DNA-binding MarR family transcriptional regulator
MLDLNVSALSSNCVLIGHCSRADCIWTRDDFLGICELMLNGNAPTDFMLVYRDEENRPRFVRSKRCKAERRAPWAWDTINDRAKNKVGIGFYPTNPDGKTRWGAMDFDAHDGNAVRARGLAIAAFSILIRHPQLYVILSTSGSEGWHLFAFTGEFHPTNQWASMFKQVAQFIGAEIVPGICEIFPSDVKIGSLPYGIRAPGTWNPKTDALSLIAYSSISPLLTEAKKEREESPFLYHATNREKSAQLHERRQGLGFRDIGARWAGEFAITQPSTRHNRLKEMVHHTFRQVGREVARLNAEAQFVAAIPKLSATHAEHLHEFEELWTWTSQQWQRELSEAERQTLDALRTDIKRDAFRIIRNFARKADQDQMPDFPLSIEHLAGTLNVTHQAVSEIRKQFIELGVIEKTADHIVNRRAARFRWLRAGQSALPRMKGHRNAIEQSV